LFRGLADRRIISSVVVYSIQDTGDCRCIINKMPGQSAWLLILSFQLSGVNRGGTALKKTGAVNI
jgi:hypothetical protein